MAWEIATWRWSARDQPEETRRRLAEDVQDAAARDRCEIIDGPTIEVHEPEHALREWPEVRSRAPRDLDGSCLMLARAKVHDIEPRDPRCPECDVVVKNYRKAEREVRSPWDEPEQTVLPDWCELLPCGHIVAGRQIEAFAGRRSTTGFLVHER